MGTYQPIDRRPVAPGQGSRGQGSPGVGEVGDAAMGLQVLRGAWPRDKQLNGSLRPSHRGTAAGRLFSSVFCSSGHQASG